MSTKTIFMTDPGFCADCGSILPLVKEVGHVTCYMCHKVHPIDVFGKSKVQYTITFNSLEACEKQDESERQRNLDNENEEEGPIVERKCPKCGNEKMSYAALQLRSADEGQTVFFTCTKCKHKESENS